MVSAMPDTEPAAEPVDPMVEQFMTMLKAMPDDALVGIYELIEKELDERGVFEPDNAIEDDA